MLMIKFETKSARVKGLAFHPRRRWILVSLHNGIIQLWDYNEKTLLDKYDEHKGPVRGLDFHKQQPLFVSGGDDHKIRVWHYKSRRCLFTLEAHDDYIRSTYFHHEYPWILSASDDQTVRIWNWQSRTRVAILTGHTHYVMCAQFHPKLDLIVSASIDQTLRVWDVSGLRRKSDDANVGMPNILSKTDFDVKQIEAHNSEINWCCFHPDPNKSYMLSAGDDNYIKIWRLNPYREIDTFRGHYNNVNCAIFHPKKNLVLSSSEDRSIRIWDLDKRAPLHTHRKEVERFWILASHPKETLFAAGHDAGMMIFKLERERPPFSLVDDQIFYISNNQLFKYKIKTEGQPSQSKVVFSLKIKPELTHHYHRVYLKGEYVLISIRSSNIEKSIYDLYKLTDSGSHDANDRPEPVRSPGLTALFVGVGRIAILDKTRQVAFKSKSAQERKVKVLIKADEIYQACDGKLFTRNKDEFSLWDLDKGIQMKTVKIQAKYIVQSDDKQYIAFVDSTKMTICDKDFKVLCTIQEQRKIKSVAWEEDGVLIYTTPVHIKYALIDGETTTIMSVDTTLYIAAVRDGNLFCIDRNGEVRRIVINKNEYRFKQAVIRGDIDGMVTHMRNMKTIKQSHIAYLIKKNYPDLALSSVKDHNQRFPLALKAYRLDEATKSAEVLNKDKCWEELADVAMLVGDMKTAEKAYTKLKKPYKLAMLALRTGIKDKLIESRKLAKEVGDKSTEFIVSLFLKDFERCARLMLEHGYHNLAYLCAINHDIPSLANEIKSELTPEQKKKLPTKQVRNELGLLSSYIPDKLSPLLLESKIELPSRTALIDLQLPEEEVIEEQVEPEKEDSPVEESEEEKDETPQDSWDDEPLEDLNDDDDYKEPDFF